MTLDTYFRAIVFLSAGCSVLVLAASNGVSLFLVVLFFLLLVLAWALEGTRWQVPGRAGSAAVLLMLPLLYLTWRYGAFFGVSGGSYIPNLPSYLLLVVMTLKLLQVKTDRDWLLLFLLSFVHALNAVRFDFGVAAGILSVIYVFLLLGGLVCFEFRRTVRRARGNSGTFIAAGRVPVVVTCVFVLTCALSLPLFFVVPRLNASAFARTNSGAARNLAGFSERMTLGRTGRVEQTDEVVMRVQVESVNHLPNEGLRWRGVTFDEFDGREWRRNYSEFNNAQKLGRGFFALATTRNPQRLLAQDFYLEPNETTQLFAAPRAVALQGALPYVLIDEDGSLTTREHAAERVLYRVYSDTERPSDEELRKDKTPYPHATARRYLQLPDALDRRIKTLTDETLNRAGAVNRLDSARAIENYLRGSFKYSLDMRAEGQDPLADFLFRVQSGHCEYFAAAMSVMLRTQGIAARVVNGFQAGEYNEVSDAYVVRQRNAHSWVEVYFPATDSWITFDPTPPDDSALNQTNAAWLSGRLAKYSEAMQLFWLRYVISYDKQAQRSLANKLRAGFESYAESLRRNFDRGRAAVADVLKNDSTPGKGNSKFNLYVFVGTMATACVLAFGLLLIWKHGPKWHRPKQPTVTGEVALVDFYRRMTESLERRGMRRAAGQTPLEFAESIGHTEVLTLTRLYNRVRYGAGNLSAAEMSQVEDCLRRIEAT